MSHRKVSAYITADQLFTMTQGSTANSTNNEHVSVRTGPESEGRQPFLMNQVLFTSQVGGCPLHGDHMAPGLKAQGSGVSTPQRVTIM